MAKPRLKWCLAAMLAAVFFAAPPAARADEIAPEAPSPAEGSEDALDLSALGADSDELLLFADIPTVISASRREQRMDDLAVPVTLITTDDIYYSGATLISDLLRYAPGVDVLSLRRDDVMVGIRGHHGIASDRTLVLVDGRNINAVDTGGVLWSGLPVLIQDVERIEIVRGPIGAAWGANAFNGAINIITKDPATQIGWYVESTADDFGDLFHYARYGYRNGDWMHRLSVRYQDTVSAGEALDEESALSKDWTRTWQFNSKAVKIDGVDKTTMEFAYVYYELGDSAFNPYMPVQHGIDKTALASIRFDRELDDGGSAYVQAHSRYNGRVLDSFGGYWSIENNLEAQRNFAPTGNHHLSMGGNARFNYIVELQEPWPTTHLLHERYKEKWMGFFVSDRYNNGGPTTLEAQIRGDWYSVTGMDYSSRLSMLRRLDEAGKHVLRVSAARAFRAPVVNWRQDFGKSGDMGGGLYWSNLMPRNIKNEETYALEAGYTAQLDKGLSFRADTYYQHYDRLIGIRWLTEPAPQVGRFFWTMDNMGKADSYGAELELSLKREHWQTSLWYAYNGFDLDYTDQPMRAHPPAPHKVGLTGRLFAGDGWIFNANYRYTDETPANGSIWNGSYVDAHHRMDLAVTKEFAGGRGSATVGVNDVFENEYDGIDGGHDLPGRTFFARIGWEF